MNLKENIKNYIQKIPAFLSGFLLGVVFTGAFFLFKINEYILQIKDVIYPKITIVEKPIEQPPSAQKTKKQKKNLPIKDSLKNINDTNINTPLNTNETTPIIEEKIISQRKVRIIHISSATDSTIAQLADAPTYLKDGEINILFKKTPFNSKGYYFDNNQLILYGLQDIPYINLYEYQNDLFIKYDKIVFKLLFTTQFQPFVKVEDEFLLAKMN